MQLFPSIQLHMRDKKWNITIVINVLIYRPIEFNINLLIFDKTKTVIVSE